MTGIEYLVVVIITMIISVAISMIMAPDPERPVAGQMDVPTAEEGRPIPVCFGTNIIKQSNVIWYGNPSTVAIKKKGGK